jgi:hypothetical protein
LESHAAVEQRLGTYLHSLPSKGADGPAPVPLRVVIDQLDESPFLANLPAWLKHSLKGRDTRTLRIWIACRTADYPGKITDILTNELGSCVVGDLAPLTHQDVTALIGSTGTDTDVFLTDVVNNSLGILAAIPLTLKVLLNAYRQDHAALRAGPLRLFELGVRVLANEPDPDRVSNWSATTVEQRVAIAARVAAHLVLSGRRSVHTTVLDYLSDSALPLDEVVGDNETAGAGQFSVTNAMVKETLATALFTHTSPHTVAFAHSSFAAFLAARHLVARITSPTPIPQRQLEGLFLVSAPDEDTAAVPEQLRETAAWLLAHAPRQTRWLAAADPEGLAGYTSVITDPHIRAVAIRQSAAKAAMAVAPNPATIAQLPAALTDLVGLSDDEAGPTSPTELVGTLLHILWPDHLTFTEAAPHIKPISTDIFIGMYHLEVRRFPLAVADHDVPTLVSLAEATLRDHGVKLDQPDPAATYE